MKKIFIVCLSLVALFLVSCASEVDPDGNPLDTGLAGNAVYTLSAMGGDYSVLIKNGGGAGTTNPNLCVGPATGEEACGNDECIGLYVGLVNNGWSVDKKYCAPHSCVKYRSKGEVRAVCKKAVAPAPSVAPRPSGSLNLDRVECKDFGKFSSFEKTGYQFCEEKSFDTCVSVTHSHRHRIYDSTDGTCTGKYSQHVYTQTGSPCSNLLRVNSASVCKRGGGTNEMDSDHGRASPQTVTCCRIQPGN